MGNKTKKSKNKAIGSRGYKRETYLVIDVNYRCDDELGRLLKDMGESDPDKIQDETIREQVLYFKRGEGKKELTERIENRVIKAMEDGRKEGDRIRSKQIAYRMSSLGYTKKEIYDITGIDYK